MDNTGATIALDGRTGPWDLDAGSISGGTITTAAGDALVATNSGTNVLSGVTLDGTLDMASNYAAHVTVTGGLTLDGQVLLGSADGSDTGYLDFSQSETLSGTGSILFGGSVANFLDIPNSSITLTIGAGLTLHGQSGTIGGGAFVNHAAITADQGGTIQLNGTNWTNDAAITAPQGGNFLFSGTNWTNQAPVTAAQGGTFVFQGTNWTNTGAIQTAASAASGITFNGTFTNTGAVAAAGSMVTFAGTWSNSGPITSGGVNLSGTWTNTAPITASASTVDFGGTWSNTGGLNQTDCTVNLGGTFDLSGMGTIVSHGGLLELTGTLNNNGTLALDDTTGALYLQGGTIHGGTVTTSGGATLIAFSLGGTLDGVTLAGTLDAAYVFVRPGVTVTGGLTLSNGLVELSGNNWLNIVGSQTLGGTGTVQMTGLNAGYGVLVPGGGDTLTIAPGVTIRGDSGIVGPATIPGGFITNQGTIASDAGGTIVVRDLTNFAGGTLAGGTWQASNAGTLRLIGAAITTDAATVVLSGAGSQILSDAGTTDALANLSTITAAGGLTVSGGATLTTGAGLTSAGTIAVGPGGLLAAPRLTQTAGSTTLLGGTLEATGPGGTIAIQGGSLSGSGTLLGSLTNAGQIDLGAAPGVLVVTGTFTQTAAGSLALKIGGTTAGSEYDQVQVGGAATLGGTLSASLLAGFGPSALQVFHVITDAGSSGGFATVNLPMIGGAPAFLARTSATGYDLVGAATAADLAVDPASITITPSPAIVGQMATIQFTVDNQSTVTAAGNWVDSVYLSFGTSLSAHDLLIGRVALPTTWPA